jgi:hypothetical protein
MKTPMVIVLMALVLGVGSTLAFMNNACKSGQHGWCGQIFGTAQGQGAANQLIDDTKGQAASY